MTEEEVSNMDQYTFRLCLYVNQVSTNNCKDGNLTSLPLKSSIVLWNIIFDNKFDNQSDSSFNNTNVTPAHVENTYSLLIYVIASIAAVVFACVIFFRTRQCWRKMKKDASITIPADGLDTDGLSLDDGLAKSENKNKLEYEDESSSVDTFNEYDIPQRLQNYKYAQHIGILQRKGCFNKKNYYVEDSLSTCTCTAKQATRTETEKMQKVDIKCTDTLGSQNGHEDKFHKESKSYLDLNVKCEVVHHVRSPVGESTSHVLEATDKNYADCNYNKSNEETHEEPPVAKSWDENQNDASSVDVSKKTGDNDTALVPADQSTKKLDNIDNEDYTRYNWTEIFTYLAQKIIDPKEYVLFFIILLADAGYESPKKRISTIEENTKGNITRTLIELFYLWKDRVGSEINPKHIEDTFEKLEWNTQLHEFKTYLRDPPLLKNRKTLWKPLNELDTRWPELVNDQNNLPDLMCRKQVIVIPKDESFQISEEELVYEHKQNGENILKRRKRIVRKVSDRKRLKKDNNKCSINSNTSNKRKNRQITFHKNRHKGAKNVYHRHKIIKHPVIKQNISGEICFGNTSDGFAMISDNSYTDQFRGNADSGFGSSCYTPEMSHINSNQFSHDEQVGEHAADPTRQSQTSQGTNYTIKTITGPEQNELGQTTSFQRERSCQATSSHWNVKPNLMERPKMVNRKRHIEKTRDGLEDCCLKKTKVYAKSVSINSRHKIHKRGKKSINWKQNFLGLIERCFESKLPVNEKEFNSFIENLLSRLTPLKDDIVSLRLQSYMTAQAFSFNNGEIIHILSTEKHLLVLREKEWTSLKTYVEFARPDLMKKTQGYVKTDFLFLGYDGKPLIQEF